MDSALAKYLNTISGGSHTKNYSSKHAGKNEKVDSRANLGYSFGGALSSYSVMYLTIYS